MPDKVIVFDVWGDYAHFRKNYATSSPLTYSFPPRTALSGLIGAITGLDKTEYFRHFFKEDAEIGCKILAPVKKVRIGENLIDTKNTGSVKMHLIKNRTQIRFEFVKDPKYRIYFSHLDKNFYKKLRKHLINHQSVYTPCLGLSQLICNFAFVGEFGMKRSSEEFQTVDSVVLGKYLHETDFEVGKEYFSEVMPCEMGEGREVTDYSEILFERNGKAIRAKVKKLWTVENGERIVFL